MSDPTEPISHRLLFQFIDDALRQQPSALGLYAAAQIAAGQWRLVALFDLDDTSEPIPGSLTYQVEVHGHDGLWRPLCRVHWSLLALEAVDVQNALEDVLRQHAQGTYPGGPADPHP
jgi:muconolactone delta-isomerase